MKNFIFKSEADFHKIITSALENLNKNTLYCTHRLDKIEIDLKNLIDSMAVENQANSYYDSKEDQEPD